VCQLEAREAARRGGRAVELKGTHHLMPNASLADGIMLCGRPRVRPEERLKTPCRKTAISR